jgi:EAL domain-containing protein (putative c-di-GMP-specific phosphodiesterase class I)/CheY-like chemotaxis protein/GGDEF domain-containing protein
MLRILLVEDSHDDAELLRQALCDGDVSAELRQVTLRAELLPALHESWDLVICDHHLPDLDSLTVLDLLQAHCDAPPPVIVMSGAMPMADTVEAMRRGARDCMAKEQLPRLIPVLQRELAAARTAAELRQTRATLAQPPTDTYHSVTGLPGRHLLERQLATELPTLQAQHGAVLLLEAMQHRDALRLLGPAATTAWQTEMARRLRTQSPENAWLSQLEDDTFVLVLRSGGSKAELAALAARLRSALERPFMLADHEVSFPCRSGACQAEPTIASATTLLLGASIALASADPRRNGAYCLYTTELQRGGERRLLLESALHQALRRNEFSLRFQPQIDLNSGQIVGAEALLRWQHPTLGLISPGEFIPILEANGLIVQVDRWVLGAACRQAREWERQGLPPLTIAVNLSASHFCDPALPATVAAALADSGLPADRLELEITESMVMHGETAATAVLEGLRALGVHIALDDFGAGYSSLGYLKHFPIDTLKIDRAFIAEADLGPIDRNILQAIITLGHSLGLTVVAEGIETGSQRDFLTGSQCDIGQGYLFGRPLLAEEFTALARATPIADAA